MDKTDEGGNAQWVEWMDDRQHEAALKLASEMPATEKAAFALLDEVRELILWRSAKQKSAVRSAAE